MSFSIPFSAAWLIAVRAASGSSGVVAAKVLVKVAGAGSVPGQIGCILFESSPASPMALDIQLAP